MTVTPLACMTTRDLHQPEHNDVKAAKVYTANQLHFMHVLDHYVHMKFQSSIVVLTDIKIVFKPRVCSQKMDRSCQVHILLSAKISLWGK